MADVAVMGGGSWGSVVASIMADAGNDVALWVRRPALAEVINTSHENVDYLPGMKLPSAIVATTDPFIAMRDARVIILAVPSQFLRHNLEQWFQGINEKATLVSLAKGVEAGTLLRMSQVIEQVTGASPSRIAVLSGPNLAAEIVKKQPAAAVIACPDHSRAQEVQRLLGAPYFRPYTSTDVVGSELGGACKNVIALACGMADGLGLGSNTQAMIITRGLAEITRLGLALGAQPSTLSGLAGVGDLVATCSSHLSRNRSFGKRLGLGESLVEAQEHTNGQVAEGVVSCSAIATLAQRSQVDMPITSAVVSICEDGRSVKEMLTVLMQRSMKPEWPLSR